MKTLKRAFSLFVALVMCLSVMSLPAFAEAIDELAQDVTESISDEPSTDPSTDPAAEDEAAPAETGETGEDATEPTEETTEATTEEPTEVTDEETTEATDGETTEPTEETKEPTEEPTEVTDEETTEAETPEETAEDAAEEPTEEEPAAEEPAEDAEEEPAEEEPAEDAEEEPAEEEPAEEIVEETMPVEEIVEEPEAKPAEEIVEELPAPVEQPVLTEEELAAQAEAERLAAEEAARLEAERLAAEEAARLEAERLAALERRWPKSDKELVFDTESYRVTVTVPERAFADHVYFRVIEMQWAELDEATAELLKASGLTEDDALLDIGFEDADGFEVEPDAAIGVTIEAAEVEIAEVYHVEDAETVTQVAEEVADAATFEVESFSIFVVKAAALTDAEAELNGILKSTLAEAVSAAQEKDTIVLLQDIDATGITLTLPEGVTLQGSDASNPVTVTNMSGIAASSSKLTFKNIRFNQTSAKFTMRGSDITFENCTFTGSGSLTTIKPGTNFTFSSCIFDGGYKQIDNPTVTNLTISNCISRNSGFSFIYYGNLSGDVRVTNSEITSYAYTVHTGNGGTAGTRYEISNTVLDGWTSYGGEVESATFTNCTFNSSGSYHFIRPYRNTTFVGCEFASGFDPVGSGSANLTFIFDNCTKANVPLTKDNFDTSLGLSVDTKNDHSNTLTVIVNDAKRVGGTETWLDPVAQIEDEYYYSLEAAIADVPADGTQTTITMVGDETIDVVGSAITIPATKNVVLDLNGHTIAGYCETATTSALITNKGTLTIQDSSDTQNDGTGTGSMVAGATPTWIYNGGDDYSGSYASNLITNNGNLTIKSGHLRVTSVGSAAYVVDNNSTIGNTVLNIQGGLLSKESGTVVRMFCNSTTKENTINMTGGTISTPGYTAIWTQLPGSGGQAKKAALNISGGTLEANSYAWYDYTYGDVFDAVSYDFRGGLFKAQYSVYSFGVNKFITGGTFSAKPAGTYIADNYTTIPSGADGKYKTDGAYWTVVPARTVTFKNGDTVLETLTVGEGAVPVYDGETPTKAADAGATYAFSGWSNYAVGTALPAVGDSNVEYTAQFTATPKQYTITWVIDDVSTTQTYEYGATPSHDAPAKDATAQYSYAFAGWSPEIATVTGNATYTAQFTETLRQYKVNFVSDGTVLSSAKYNYGTAAESITVPADPTKATVVTDTTATAYAFAGWDKEIANVTGNATYTARFDETVTNITPVQNANTTTVTVGDTTIETTRNDEGKVTQVVETNTITGETTTTTTDYAKGEANTNDLSIDTATETTSQTTVTTSGGSTTSTATVESTSKSLVADNVPDTSTTKYTFTVTTETKTGATVEDAQASKAIDTNKTEVAVESKASATDKVSNSVKSATGTVADAVKGAAAKADNIIDTKSLDAAKLGEKLETLAATEAVAGADVKVDVALTIDTVLTGYTGDADNTKATSLTYEVKPYLTTTVQVGDAEAKTSDPEPVSNTDLAGTAITVKLPLPDSFAGYQKISVKHTSAGYPDEVLEAEVKGSSGSYYAEFTVTHFSSFEVIDPGSKVIVTFDANGGSAVPSRTIDKGENVGTLPSMTRGSYLFEGWFTAANGGTRITSATVVNANVTYYAQWRVIEYSSDDSSSDDNSSSGSTAPQTTTIVDETTPLSEFPIFYVDVADNSWYHDAIAYVTALELMNGVGDNHFAPDDNTTRGMVAVVMMRLASGEVVDLDSFFDVADSAYYAEAAAWAVENGVFKGYDDGSFRGEINITREQFAAVLYRYALAKGYDVSAKADLGTYDDGALVGGYASDAMAWAIANGIIKGVGGNRLDPLGNATRAQLATMLMRFDELTKDVV